VMLNQWMLDFADYGHDQTLGTGTQQLPDVFLAQCASEWSLPSSLVGTPKDRAVIASPFLSDAVAACSQKAPLAAT